VKQIVAVMRHVSTGIEEKEEEECVNKNTA
jgi:hypothetical protein